MSDEKEVSLSRLLSCRDAGRVGVWKNGFGVMVPSEERGKAVRLEEVWKETKRILPEISDDTVRTLAVG
jgi:hypothetical protein